MIDRSPYLRIAAVVLLALAAILILSASLRAHAARPAQSESDEWWARVGGLEAWYYQHGYTESPPPAAAPGSSVGVAPAAGSGIGPQSPISVTSVATIHLPYVARNHRSFEFRGVWVTRFDWTGFGITPTTATLDTMVGNIAAANFNAILFQVRGTADSYYAPGLEPWSPRLTGQLTRALGVDPGWNPLAYMVAQAHAQGIQVHAYINVFPVWLCGLGAPPNPVTPTHLFWSLSYSTTWDTWRTWTAAGPDNIDTCSDYLWATPALSLTRSHVAAIAGDLATRYDIDGIHLDLVRYPSPAYSFDPVTMKAYSDAVAIEPTLTITAWRPGFQRAQVSDVVWQVSAAVSARKPDAWVSAAVWPNYTSGYNSYFQDSKAWLQYGLVDANMPMLYSSDILNDLAAWTDRMQQFVADSYGRFVIPGIHADYADFGDIVARIDAARAAGAPGVALFSYGALNARGYFDDLGAGPFAVPAQVPIPGWKP